MISALSGVINRTESGGVIASVIILRNLLLLGSSLC